MAHGSGFDSSIPQGLLWRVAERRPPCHDPLGIGTDDITGKMVIGDSCPEGYLGPVVVTFYGKRMGKTAMFQNELDKIAGEQAKILQGRVAIDLANVLIEKLGFPAITADTWGYSFGYQLQSQIFKIAKERLEKAGAEFCKKLLKEG
jgi:hypothetical protein